jgi:hypothetical protein
LFAALWKVLGKIWTDRLRLQIEHDNNEKIENLRAGLQAQTAKTQQLLDANLQKAVLVTRTHFETEFDSYRELFAALVKVKLCMDATRPQMRVAREDYEDTKHEQLRAALGDLIAAHNSVIEMKDTLSPFYSPEVYTAVERCLNASGHEIIEIQTAGDSTFTHEWFTQGTKRKEEFMLGYQQTSKAIRDRIASLGIIP